jgi:hypothetical protein
LPTDGDGDAEDWPWHATWQGWQATIEDSEAGGVGIIAVLLPPEMTCTRVATIAADSASSGKKAAAGGTHIS